MSRLNKPHSTILSIATFSVDILFSLPVKFNNTRDAETSGKVETMPDNASNQLRLNVLMLVAVFTLGASLSVQGQYSNAIDEESDSRHLRFYHTHTGKSLAVVYFRDGKYDAGALLQLREFLADWRDQQQHDVDPGLMDILWRIQQETGHHDTYEVISAYRSPSTNRMLRQKSKGVAKLSQHLEGNAIDVRLRGLNLENLRDTAMNLKLGGVGYYSASDFVHLDTGRVRYW